MDFSFYNLGAFFIKGKFFFLAGASSDGLTRLRVGPTLVRDARGRKMPESCLNPW